MHDSKSIQIASLRFRQTFVYMTWYLIVWLCDAAVMSIDTAAIHAFEELNTNLQARGIQVRFCFWRPLINSEITKTRSHDSQHSLTDWLEATRSRKQAWNSVELLLLAHAVSAHAAWKRLKFDKLVHVLDGNVCSWRSRILSERWLRPSKMEVLWTF